MAWAVSKRSRNPLTIRPNRPGASRISKSIFSEPALAAKLVRKRLPAPIAAAADWTSLEVVPASFVKSSLSQVHSDLLFSMRIGGRRCLLYLLFEHQSTVDPAMPLRLLGYICEILLRHHKQHGLPLPPVIPFVFHQGPERWTASGPRRSTGEIRTRSLFLPGDS